MPAQVKRNLPAHLRCFNAQRLHQERVLETGTTCAGLYGPTPHSRTRAIISRPETPCGHEAAVHQVTPELAQR